MAILVVSLLLLAANIVLGHPPLTATGTAVLPDFLAYWTGGNLVADGHAAQLYDPAVQAHLQRQAVPGVGDSLSWFVAPPFVALLYWPFGALPYPVAASLFTALSLAALYLVAQMLQPTVAGRADVPSRVFWVAAAASPAVFEALGAGQNSPCLLLLWVVALQQLRAGRDTTAGALLALSAFKPHLLLLIPIWFVVRRNWRALGGFAACGVVLFAASLGFLPPHTFGAWRAALTSDTFGQQVQVGQTWKMESLSALLTDVTGWSRMDAVVLAAGALVLAWWLPRLSPDPLRDLAIVAAVTVACAPHVLLYDAVLLIIPIVWLVSEGRLRDLRWQLLALFVVQFTTAGRHLLSATTVMLGWLDWAWAAVPIVMIVVAMYRLTPRRVAR
ncbi:MAG: glycosyltransferase family 87 protein [Aeromicrobium sp.]